MESNTVDQMPKKNSFIISNQNNRGSQGAESMIFTGQKKNIGSIHNRTTSVFNANTNKGEFVAKKSVSKKMDNKKASEYIASIN